MRSKTVPTLPTRLIAHNHTAFIQEVFYIPHSEWKHHIKHHCKLDELKTGFEKAKGYRVRHVPESNIQHTVGHGSLF